MKLLPVLFLIFSMQLICNKSSATEVVETKALSDFVSNDQNQSEVLEVKNIDQIDKKINFK